jgi:hypothetical protein
MRTHTEQYGALYTDTEDTQRRMRTGIENYADTYTIVCEPRGYTQAQRGMRTHIE